MGRVYRWPLRERPERQPARFAPARERWDVVARLSLVVAVLAGLWLTEPAWGDRLPAGDDVMAHVVRTQFGLSEILGRGRLDGWFPRFMVGHQEFQFYGPGFTWAVGAVRLATFGMLSTAGALKVVVVLSLLAIGPAVAFLARSAGLSPRASGIAGVLALGVNNPFGIGVAGVFTIGLYPHQLAGPFFCLALGAALRVVVDPRRRWMALLAASLAAVVITHLITALILAIFLLLFLASRVVSARTSADALVRLAVGGAGAALLSAFWLLPFLAHRHDRGPVTTWGTPPFGERMAEIFDGRLLFGPNVAWIAAVGFGFGLARVARSRPWALAVAVAAPVYLALAHAAHSQWPGNEITLQLANRGLGYAGVVAMLPLAAGLAWAARRLADAFAAGSQRPGSERAWQVGIGVIALVAALGLATLPGDARARVRQLPVPSPDLVAAAEVLADLVPDGARFATERDFPNEIGRSGLTHPDLWLAQASGRNTVNIFNLESSPAPRAGLASEVLGEVPPADSARDLARMGVTHVVTLDPLTPARLAATPSFLPVWERGAFAILEVVPPPGQPDPASLASTTDGAPLTAELTTSRPERLVLMIDVPDATWVTLALGWSPKWHASTQGRGLPVRRSQDGQVEVQLPAGSAQVELRFRRDAWDHVGAAISLLTALAACAAALAAGRRYWSSRMSSSFSRTA